MEKIKIACKKYGSTIIRMVWYIILLSLGSLYIWKNYDKIVSSTEVNAQVLIFITWLILVIYPLFSELEIGSIKVKKEIKKLEESQAEMEESVRELRMQIIETKVSNMNNNENTVVLNTILATENGLKKIEQGIKRNKEEDKKIEKDNFNVREQKVDWFQVHSSLEKIITNMCANIGCESQKNLSNKVVILGQLKIISKNIVDALLQIIEITNRGIRGEIVDKTYEEFVKNTYLDLNSQLQEICKKFNIQSKEFEYCICPRCHYQGPSRYSNDCPNCGYTWCE